MLWAIGIYKYINNKNIYINHHPYIAFLSVISNIHGENIKLLSFLIFISLSLKKHSRVHVMYASRTVADLG